MAVYLTTCSTGVAHAVLYGVCVDTSKSGYPLLTALTRYREGLISFGSMHRRAGNPCPTPRSLTILQAAAYSFMHATAHPSHDSNKFLYKCKTCMPNGEPPTRICLDGIEAVHQGAVGSLPRAMFSPLLRSTAAAASCRLRMLPPQAADFMVRVVRRAAAAVALPPGAAAPARLKPPMADRGSAQGMRTG
jgi:hypothetical protein